MLSRIARQMYWLGRNIEHAENITRILDVNHRMSLEQGYFSELDVWSPMLAISQSEDLFARHYDAVTELNVYHFLLLNPEHDDSVLARINLAREAVRVMRDHVSSEMWMSLNVIYLDLQKLAASDLAGQQLNHYQYEALCAQIQNFCHSFHGLADNTMVHGRGWQFLRLGWSLERAQMSARILEMKYHILLPDVSELGRPLDIHQWQALLRSVSGYEAYRRLYRARIVPASVVEMFLTDVRFPRSVQFCMQSMSKALRGLHGDQPDHFDHAERQTLSKRAEKKLAGLFALSGNEILAAGLKQKLDLVQKSCDRMHDGIHRAYFDAVSHVDDRGQQQSISVQTPQQQQTVVVADRVPEHPRFNICHITRFDYSRPVTCAHSEIRKTPVDTGLQRVLSSHIRVDPDMPLSQHRDHFGNVVHHYSCLQANGSLEIKAESIVETTNAIAYGASAAGADKRDYVQRWAEYLSFSPGVPKLDVYASVPCSIDIRMDKLAFKQALNELAGYFFLNFRYDPDATDVHSSPQALFDHGGGVCQDTAHAMIGVLRSLGIASRYVSGYIYDPKTDEPGAMLRGAAATHAWVQVWHPDSGWIGVDPTNNRLVDWQYIRTAIGRDYFDVQPVRGTFLGQVEQVLSATVTVSRIEIESKAELKQSEAGVNT